MPITIPRPNLSRPVPAYGNGNSFLQYLRQMFSGRPNSFGQPMNQSPVPSPTRPGMPARMRMSAAQTTPTETPYGQGQTPYNQGQTPADAARFLSMANPGRRSSVPAGAIVHGVSAGGEPLWSFPHPGAIIHMAHPDAYHGQRPMTPEQSARISAARNIPPPTSSGPLIPLPKH